MNLRSPAKAIAWEIWARNRVGLGLVGGVVILGGLLIPWLQRSVRWGEFAGPAAYTMTGLALLVTLYSFHFTEGSRRGGFGSFPIRLFNLPLNTRWLVACPMFYGSTALVLVFLSCSRLLLHPLFTESPVLWPCLYLVFGLTQFQMILWSLAERRVLKLFCLSLAAAVLTFGWMFFIPSIVAGALNDWGFEGSVETFMHWLLMGMAVSGPGAYLVSLRSVYRQRHGIRGRTGVLSNLWEKAFGRLFRRCLPFRSISHAILWHEWRRTGLILPAVVVAVFLLTGIPTGLAGDLSGRGTVGILTWLFVSPFIFAVVIGRGFGKPDFWSPTLTIPAFHAIKPVNPGEWVLAKLKVALLSAALTWAIAVFLGFVWTAFAGNFEGFEGSLEWFRYFFSPGELALLTFFGLAAAVIITWRFLVGGLASGFYGSRKVYHFLNSLLGLGLLALLVVVIRNASDKEGSVQPYHLFPMIEWLPILLGGAVVLKAVIAAIAWDHAITRRMVPSLVGLGYFFCWLMAVGILSALSFVLCEHTPWLRHLLMMCGILAVPLAGPALAMRAMVHNRSNS